jgi:hypothetical protein
MNIFKLCYASRGNIKDELGQPFNKHTDSNGIEWVNDKG